MKLLSLKVREEIFTEVEEILKKVHLSRNAYINNALLFYNQLNKRKALRDQLLRESKATREVSLEVLSEFEKMEDDLTS